MVVDVVEPAEPGLQASLFNLDYLPAETTPESNLIVATIEAIFELSVHFGSIGNTVVLEQVCLELLAATVRSIT